MFIGFIFGIIIFDVLLVRGEFIESYKYLSYEQIYAKIDNYSSHHSSLIQMHDPEDEFKEWQLPETKCGTNKCRYFYLEMTNFENQDYKSRPQVLLVGGFHGDEQIGPNTLTYLIEYLIENRNQPLINQLLDERLIVIFPLSNPSGYYNNQREEMQVNASIDINRDFPYNQNKCFQTAAARILLGLFQKYLFQTGITFHGGMYALSYPWGSSNHQTADRYSSDDLVYKTLGLYMNQSAPGSLRMGMAEYPVGNLNDEIYPADGTLEDWSYSGTEGQSYNAACKDFKHAISDNSLKTLFYLVEASDPKRPLEKYLGSSQGINNPESGSYGFIARNINLALANIESVAPLIRLSYQNLGDYRLSLRWQVYGCYSVEKTQLYYKTAATDSNNQTHQNPKSKDQISQFEGFLKAQGFQEAVSLSGQGKIDNREFYFQQTLELEENSKIHVYLTVQCDGILVKRSMKSHFSQSRLNPDYFIQNEFGYSVQQNNFTVRLFQNIPVTLELTETVNPIDPRHANQANSREPYNPKEVFTMIILVFFLCVLVALLVYRLFYRPKYQELVEQLERERQNNELVQNKVIQGNQVIEFRSL